jgi:hypothetical protein
MVERRRDAKRAAQAILWFASVKTSQVKYVNATPSPRMIVIHPETK